VMRLLVLAAALVLVAIVLGLLRTGSGPADKPICTVSVFTSTETCVISTSRPRRSSSAIV